jgi:subtilase family serine protease
MPGTNIELNGSGVNGGFLDTNSTTGLVYFDRNTTVLGRYIFTVRTGGGPLVSDGSGSAAPNAPGFTPAQIRAAYGINSLSGLGAALPTPPDGSGQTIAIVAAYDNPTIWQAVDTFDNQFSLTAAGRTLYGQYGPASSFLTVLNQNGQTAPLPATDPNGPGNANWELETALDVEWAHAIAPGASIVLVEASSQTLPDLMAGVGTAADLPGVSVVSMSWGFVEGQAVLQSDEALYDRVLTTPAGHSGVTFVASSGDYGAAVQEYPASSPNVLAVGGTSLSLNPDNSYAAETGWGYYDSGAGTSIGSGGGLSLYEPAPAYQAAVQSTGYRTTPDVSLVADPATGAWVADPYNLAADTPWEVVAGTSLSAPTWAGLLALVNQGRAAAGAGPLGSASDPTATQEAIYSVPYSDFNDITSGNNGYSAGVGYDLVTGLGTPVATQLLPDLVAYAGTLNYTTPAGQVPITGSIGVPAGWGGPLVTLSPANVLVADLPRMIREAAAETVVSATPALAAANPAGVVEEPVVTRTQNSVAQTAAEAAGGSVPVIEPVIVDPAVAAPTVPMVNAGMPGAAVANQALPWIDPALLAADPSAAARGSAAVADMTTPPATTSALDAAFAALGAGDPLSPAQPC